MTGDQYWQMLVKNTPEINPAFKEIVVQSFNHGRRIERLTARSQEILLQDLNRQSDPPAGGDGAKTSTLINPIPRQAL